MARSNHYRPELILKDNLQKLRNATKESDDSALAADKPDYSSPPRHHKLGYPDAENLSLLFNSVRKAIDAKGAILKKENNKEDVSKRLLTTAAKLDSRKEELKKTISPVIIGIFLYYFVDDNEKQTYASTLEWFNHWQGYHIKKFTPNGFNDLMDTLMDEILDEKLPAQQKNITQE